MKIIIHCSDSSFGNAALISKWHSLPKPDGRGWSNIGYHYVILNGQLSKDLFNHNFNGHLETGRPLDDDNKIDYKELGAHTKGYNDNIGICLIGRSNKFTDPQIVALHKLIELLSDQFTIEEILQHSDLDPKKPYCAGLKSSIVSELNCLFKNC